MWFASFAHAASPYEQSTYLTGISFNSSSYFQRGQGSDQWVMTLGNDGNVYAAWGDGQGWSLSFSKEFMGVTRISGTPPSLTGTDVWHGDNKNRKPSGGLIADGGQMYMFYETPNDSWDGSYGFSSPDNGTTWTDTNIRVFSKSGDGVVPIGFLQFGPGYTGLPSPIDGSYFYVYLAKHSESTGGGSGPNVYLARVLKGSVFTRSAFSYYQGVDGSGNPIWTSDFSAKIPHSPELSGSVSQRSSKAA